MKRGDSDLLIDLANLGAEGLAAFRRSWWDYRNYSDEDLLKRRDELRTLAGHRFVTLPRFLSESEATLEEITEAAERWPHSDYSARLADDAEGASLLPQKLVFDRWLAAQDQGLRVGWVDERPVLMPKSGKLEAALLLLCIEHYALLRPCYNPRCEHSPYFLASRRDQRFCSPKCTEYGQKMAKWKWWHENRSKAAREASEQAAKGE
jgi:hypothetical protein